MLRRARHCYGKVVCLSVCLSVTLRCRDHTGWTPSKIISRLVSLGCSLIRKCKNPLGKNVSRYKSASLTVQGESWQENGDRHGLHGKSYSVGYCADAVVRQDSRSIYPAAGTWRLTTNWRTTTAVTTNSTRATRHHKCNMFSLHSQLNCLVSPASENIRSMLW